MNLSNEKNTLLNTVSRLAVSEGARLLGKYVTRGAMMAAALTIGTVVVMDSRPAIASCSDSDFDSNGDGDLAGDTGSSGVEVICSGTVAGGYDADGYDQIDVRVIGDGAVNPSSGVAIYFGNGTDGDVFDGSITVEDTFIGGATNVGKVISTNSDAIVIEGDNNVINNGLEDEEGPDEVGGGLIQGAEDGIDIDGNNNVVHNLNNGYGTGSGVISGGGGLGDDGIEVSGGTSGAANVIDNGLDGDGNGNMAYIVSGGTPGATNVDGDDGIDADGWATINNGKMGEIHGEDRGIEFTGPSGSTLTVDNDGKIIGDQEDGIVIQSDDVIVNYSGGGTLSGGREVGGGDGAGIDVGSGHDNIKVNVTFDKGGLIEGFTHGIEVGPKGDNNILVLKGEGTIEGDGNAASDGIHVFEAGTGNDITLDDGILVQGKDDGIDLGSGNILLVDGKSTVQGDTNKSGDGDGIQANDNNTIHITGESKVIGDPGILVDDSNTITIDGGSDVTGNPEDGINADDGNSITVGGAGGAGTVYGKGANSDGISLTDAFDDDGGGQDGNSVTIGKDGTVDAQRDGIVVGQDQADNEGNSVLIEDGGNVIAGRDGIVVNGQDADAYYNTVTINDGGEVNAKGDGVRLLGDSIVTNVFDALVGGGPVIFGEPDGVGNDLRNDGIIRAGDDGVLVSNTNSDVDNSGGEIYAAGGDGVRFTTLHTDEADADGGGVDESGYQSDADSLIVAGRDGIHYDNYDDDAFGDDALQVTVTGEDVNGLGQVDVNLLNVFPIIKGYFPEVVENDGVIEAQRHGISVNDDFDVTNGEDGVIVAGGLPGEGASGGDGIHADANNRIDNFGTIATGADADGDSHGIEVDGESNTIINAGLIDTRGDTNIDRIDNGTLEKGSEELQDNGAGGDGIHANSDGLTLGGLLGGYDQQQIRNYGTIIAADDGIDAQSGLGIPGGEQIIYNGLNGEITANDDGIHAENYNDIWNRGVINADDDGEDGGDGIEVGHSNVVTNDGEINSINGNGIVMGGQKGPFSFGNLVTNTGDIVAGEDGILALGDENYIENTGNIKGGEDGVDLEGRDNTFVSTDGVIEGGSGAGINSDDHNTIELSGTTKVTSTDGSGGDGIVLDNFNSLTIEDGVTVHGDNDGIVLDGSHNAVEYEGDEGVSKDPELTGKTGDGIRINGSSNTFITTDDVDVSGGDDGIDIGGNNNYVEISGDVSGGEDGLHLDTATGNVVYVGGNVTGDSDDNEGGDGVDIFGGGSNSITVDGAISGDPGVVITNSSNNSVSGGSISGTNGGVIISTGNNNTVTSNTYIEGGAGDGVGITGKSNIVTAGEDISGNNGVVIHGNLNEVSGHDINGSLDGVSIDGIGNVITATGAITGEDSQGVAITGKNNTVTADGAITGWDEGVLIDGNNNEVSSSSISGTGEDGVGITGDSNTIDTGTIFGGTDGVNIYGDSNNVDSTGISGDADAVEITGDNNTIDVDGDIDGDVEQLGYGNGVLIDGSNNSVSANNIGVSGTGSAGVSISGDNNTIDANGSISGEDGAGVYLDGDSNSVDADGAILSLIDDGVAVTGDNNDVTSGSNIIGGEDGTEIDGNGNSVVANGTIDGNGEDGVDIDGNNNSVEAYGVEGLNDGLLVFGSNNTIEFGENGITGQKDDGVDMFGLGNEVVVLGTIYGLDDGVVLEAGNSSVVAFGGIEGENGDGVNIGGTNNIVAGGEYIQGGSSGVVIDGDSNTVSSQDITGEDGDGVNIAGNSNGVDASGNVKGTDDGVEIDGNSNIVNVDGTITGTSGDGVDIAGSSNLVKANGITGDPGVIILGANNVVSAGAFITGTVDDGVNIIGDSNTVGTIGAITGATDGIEIVFGSNNSINANSVEGGTNGATVDGSSNVVTIGAGGIVGKNGDGLAITGGTNTVTSGGNVTGTDDGVEIDGNGNQVSVSGAIGGTNGQGVDINGSNNGVSATGNIASNNAEGVLISGNGNTVSSTAQIVGSTGGAIFSGNQNTVTATDDITTINGFGVGITGNQNIVNAGDDIKSNNNDGVNIAGNQNQVSANDIYGGIDGIQINGNQNFVDAAATVTGVTGNGVHFDSGTGNNVDLTYVTVTAGKDGILVDVDGNEFQHNSKTVINAGDDGIDYGFGGLVNAYESLVWAGTINAKDDGIVADKGFFTIINNGKINADTDKNKNGNGITVTSDNTVENNGTITGWNGIVGDDRNIITNDGTIIVTNDGIVVDDDNKVINNGTITAADDGIVADDKNYIENNSNLTINAKDNGIEVDDSNKVVNTGTINADTNKNNDGTGIVADDFNDIDTSGTITGYNGIEVGDSNKVVNTGTINADTDKNNDGTGIVADDFNDIDTSGTITGYNGIEIDYTNVVLNSGSITATNFGVLATNDANKITNDSYISAGTSGVRVVYGDYNVITNNDYIHGGDTGVQIDNGDENTLTNNSGAEIHSNNEGVNIQNDSDSNTVNNYGEIDASDEGIEVETNSDGNVINNWGDIYGREGVEFENNATFNVLNNWGLIDGVEDGVDIENANYNDVNNYGIIIGEGYAGIYIEDSDVTDIYSNGTIIGSVYGVEGIYSDSTDISTGSSSVIVGGFDGINMYESDYFSLHNSGSVTGVEGDGVEVSYSDHADIANYSTGSIFGGEDGVYVSNGEDTGVYNHGMITGGLYDGIEFANSDHSYVYNEGTITGEDDGIDNWAYGQAGTLFVWNTEGGTITGQNEDGIYTEGDTVVYNTEGSTITGGFDGIHADYNASLYVWNWTSTIEGQDGDGIYTWSDDEGSADVVIYNGGLIQGAIHGIHNEGNSNVFVENYSTGVITGTDAGYLYEDNGYSGDATVQINNDGLIEVTGDGVLPEALVDDPATKDVDESKGTPDFINGEGADPVAAIDVRDGGPGLQTFVFNWGEINGANEFSAEIPDDPATKDKNEFAASKQLTNRFAILGGEGNEYIANFNGGTINGDIATQAGDDVLSLEIGSTLNGNVNLGQTLQTDEILALIKDDPATKDVDESKGGTAVGLVSTENVDVGLDTVVLFGEGYQDLASNITEAEILYVNDELTQWDIYDGAFAMATQPVLENQPTPVGTWSLNGNVKVDGTNLWTFVDIDTNGDGKTDEEGLSYISGTVGTEVDNGRLNVGGTIFVVTDEEKGTGNYVVQKTASLTSPVVDVWSGGTLGGHGTIVTNPGANGGNGGVNLTGAVQGDKTFYLGATESTIHEQDLESEARGAFIIGTTTVDLVTQKADGTITDNTKGDGTNDFTITKVDGKDVKADVKVTVDSIGNLYPDIKLPAGWVSETFSGPFDFTTDSPRYATLAPGDEITRIGTLTVVGNVTMDDRETATTTYTVKVADDPATKDVDESKGGTATKTQTGRTVVTNWGSQFQADLKADGTGDRLNVVKSGTTKAFTGSTFDVTGPGTVDLVTQDKDGKVTDGTKGDGVNDFTIVTKDSVATKVDTLVAGKGKADGVPDGIAYKVSTVLDGHATVDGRLDIRLDGQFVDLVDNSEPATIPDPDGPTGCGTAPDGADSCPQVPNPAYKIPDGIADVDAKGIAKNNADFSKDAKVWDIIVAAGGVSGKFDEKGFDGGPNDGAVVVRYDDPETAADEEVRVQLLKAYLQYLPDRVRIISIPKFGPKGTTINQTATGNYLDTLTKYGLNEDALHAAIALVGTASNIPAALDALHPEWYNAFNEVGFSIARGAEQQAYIRTIEAQGFSGGQQNRVVMNVGDDSVVGSSASDRRATFWLAGSWGNANIDDGSDEGWLEYKYETLTGYAGFDYMINPNFLVGIMGGFSNSNVDAKNASGNKGDVDSWQVSGYVSYFTDSWFLNAGGGIGDMNIESIRNIQFGSGIGNISEVANADYDGDITFFYGKGGYSFDLGASGWKLSPELALSYAEVKQNGFSETGTGNAPVFLLNVDGQSEKSLRGTAQLRLSKTFLSGNGGGWMPYVRVGLANEFEDDLRPITSGFQGAPGTSFTVFGQVPRQTTVIFGAGITGKVTEMFSLYLDYSGEIGGSFSEHVISGGVRLHF